LSCDGGLPPPCVSDPRRGFYPQDATPLGVAFFLSIFGSKTFALKMNRVTLLFVICCPILIRTPAVSALLCCFARLLPQCIGHTIGIALLTEAVYLSLSLARMLKVLRCSMYSHLTSLAPRIASDCGGPVYYFPNALVRGILCYEKTGQTSKFNNSEGCADT